MDNLEISVITSINNDASDILTLQRDAMRCYVQSKTQYLAPNGSTDANIHYRNIKAVVRTQFSFTVSSKNYCQILSLLDHLCISSLAFS